MSAESGADKEIERNEAASGLLWYSAVVSSHLYLQLELMSDGNVACRGRVDVSHVMGRSTAARKVCMVQAVLPTPACLSLYHGGIDATPLVDLKTSPLGDCIKCYSCFQLTPLLLRPADSD